MTSTRGAARPLVSARGLTRRYRGTEALRGVDLELWPGESVALLGPNGAGKTTLLSILAGSEHAGDGSLSWPGDRPPRMGWVPQRAAVYRRLSARENLRLFAGLERDTDPSAAAERLIARADLGEVADRQAGRLSTGTLQRLNLAVALAGAPAALLLDEPTATLSPEQRRRLWAWLHQLRAEEGLALLFSTQSVEEASRHGDRMVVLVDGRLAFAGTAEDLLALHGDGGDGPDAAETAFLRLIGPAG